MRFLEQKIFHVQEKKESLNWQPSTDQPFFLNFDLSSKKSYQYDSYPISDEQIVSKLKPPF